MSKEDSPKKWPIASNTRYDCYECSNRDSLFFLQSMSKAKKHHADTGHPIAINVSFYSVYGSEEQYQLAREDYPNA